MIYMPNDLPNITGGKPMIDAPDISTPTSLPDYGAWPSVEDNSRILSYEYYMKLFLGNHFDAFSVKIDSKAYNAAYGKLRYITVNFAGLISRICADMLFSEAPKIKMEKGDQNFMTALWEANRMDVQVYESALSNSAMGDALFRVRTGKGKDGKDTVIIEDVTPFIYFPVVNGFNARSEPQEEVLAWQFMVGTNKYLRKEIHTAGMIRNEVWLLKDGRLSTPVGLDILTEVEGRVIPEEQPTGIDRKLLIHIPNWKVGNRYFGLSDYYDLDSLFYGLNNRISKVDNILDKHSDPILIVPDGVLDEKGNIKRGNPRVMEVKEGENGKPEYIVWDASLENAFKEIEKMVEFMYLVAEISPDILGLGEGVSDSGRALKFKLMRTIAKTSRKKLYYNHGLKEVLYVAQLMAKKWGLGVGDDNIKMKGDPERPNIMFQDGLPIDESEQVDTETKAIDAGLTTTKDAIMRVYGYDDETAERVAADAKKENAVNLPVSNIAGTASDDDAGDEGDTE
ncbi:MAG: hypothetical protein MOGMAGMI_01809 [Candidatus Omnitrophica bacterium]|nr:hypothetical protein [Candidatus Omnitrophota bacterium]